MSIRCVIDKITHQYFAIGYIGHHIGLHLSLIDAEEYRSEKQPRVLAAQLVMYAFGRTFPEM